jgi:hypothetical protein
MGTYCTPFRVADWQEEPRDEVWHEAEGGKENTGWAVQSFEAMSPIIAKQALVRAMSIEVRRQLQVPKPTSAGFPRVMIAFYVSGLLCSLVFASLLALSAVGVNILHPFLSLLGLVGGLGWLTTVWADLLSWKREKLAEKKPVGITAR